MPKGSTRKNTRHRFKDEWDRDIHNFCREYRKTGNFRAACDLVGIAQKTLRDYLDRNPAARNRVAKVKAELIRELVGAQVTAATVPDNHGRLDSKAGQFLLTNLDPQEYRLRREIELGGGLGAAFDRMRDLVGAITPAERAELRELAKRRAIGAGEVIDVTPKEVPDAVEARQEQEGDLAEHQ